MADEVIGGVPETVLRWLSNASDASPVAPGWVPGLNSDERRRLGALGGLVSALAGNGAGPAFSQASLASWLSAGPVPPEDVILAGKQLLADSPDDGLARLYSLLVSGRSRRTLGTFFTPPQEVVWMVEQWQRRHGAPTAITDVGAGVGIFTTVAASQWPQSQVWAVDINPITLGLLALRVQGDFPLRAPEDLDGPGLRLVLDDITVWMNSQWNRLPGRRLVLGNPPYTRLQLLPMDQRERLWETSGGLCGRRASLSALITAMSLRSLGPEDGLSLLLPAQWLESDYAAGLRSFLWDLSDRRVELHLFDNDVFEGDAQVDAVALMVGPVEADTQPIVFSSDAGATERQRHDACPPRWRSLFRESPTPAATSVGLLSSDVVLSDLVTVRRGVATGANEFFVMTEARRAELGLARSMVTPLVRRLLDAPDVVTDESLAEGDPGERYWLLTAKPKQMESFVPLATYVAHGEADGQRYDLRHLCRNRSRWYDLTHEVTYPDVIVGQSTKKTFRFVEVEAKATLVNNLYGLTWKPGIAADVRADLLSWLRGQDGQAAVTEMARAQGMGLLKIEPKALLAVRLPRRFAQPSERLL